MPVSVIFHYVHMENAIFAPTAGRLETPITVVLCIRIAFSVKNYLCIILIWSSILANKLQKCRFPAPDLWCTLAK